jgi:hypothetical protein
MPPRKKVGGAPDRDRMRAAPPDGGGVDLTHKSVKAAKESFFCLRPTVGRRFEVRPEEEFLRTNKAAQGASTTAATWSAVHPKALQRPPPRHR